MEYTKESLSEINARYLGSHKIDNFEVEMANRKSKLIEDSRSKKIPLAGDTIQLTTKYGSYYEHAHIEEIYEDGKANICYGSSKPFVDYSENRLSYSTSGGPWEKIDTSKLKYLGEKEKRFCDWGKNGAVAAGAVDFFAKVSVWEYVEENPLYEKYSEKEYDRYYFSKVGGENKHSKPVEYLSYASGMRFSHIDFIQWKRDMKAVQFGDLDRDNNAVVFAYKRVDKMISRNIWGQIDLPIIFVHVNGPTLMPVKVEYKDDIHQAIFYRYTNSSTDV